MELLERHSEGVIALTGCLQSRFCQRLDPGARATRRASTPTTLMGVFGAENVYFEVQNNKIPEQDRANEGIARIAREVGRPLVGTADVHYLRREDYDTPLRAAVRADEVDARPSRSCASTPTSSI